MVAAANWRLYRGSKEGQDEAIRDNKPLEEAPQTLSLFAAGAKEWAKVKAKFFPTQDHLSMSALALYSSELLQAMVDVVADVYHP